ncbi:hypothetical protein Holit_03243 [Hollandina sp. SP2]
MLPILPVYLLVRYPTVLVHHFPRLLVPYLEIQVVHQQGVRAVSQRNLVYPPARACLMNPPRPLLYLFFFQIGVSHRLRQPRVGIRLAGKQKTHPRI